ASELAGKEAAAYSVSFGGCQMMGFNYQVCGYESATDLSTKFAEDERWHVLGFFDFVKSNNLAGALRSLNWEAIPGGYNGSGQKQTYGKLIRTAYNNKPTLLRWPKVPVAPMPVDAGAAIGSTRDIAGASDTPTASDGVNIDGFVLRIRRLRTEQRRGE